MVGQLTAVFLQLWLAALTGIVAYKLLIGRINVRGLLLDKEGAFSPERAQMLLVTVASAAAYAQDSIAHHTLVQPGPLVLSGVAGSQILYLAGKYVRQLASTRS